MSSDLEVAEKGLDWNTLGPVVQGYRDRTQEWVKLDSRKLSTNEAYDISTASDATNQGRELSIKQFAEQRRKFLMSHPEVIKAVKGL